ncbi:DUF5615 family PIN-like protein [Phenylobacterium sp. LjRoot219]|uniref:DUF5615 family PIN-like protein n=1 Tax=Phenylobacterium sp. LjRoot219 TaxID=3342283 RepID=UPI003ECCA62E
MQMRFLCDEMLLRLARLLRAAGYDTQLAQGQRDAELLALARAENRVLVTRDKRLAVEAHPRAVLVEGRGAHAEAESLAAALPIDWRLAPFSRCLVDNAPLSDAEPADLARIPEEARDLPGPFRACATCGRVYWPGSHVKRLGERLGQLAQFPPRS